ncbi:hypothetical protein J2X77_002524 [Sphingobacterium sp. 2149]|nr:hypothetical protein [Sphingobacterium sp. 2149]
MQILKIIVLFFFAVQDRLKGILGTFKIICKKSEIILQHFREGVDYIVET